MFFIIFKRIIYFIVSFILVGRGEVTLIKQEEQIYIYIYRKIFREKVISMYFVPMFVSIHVLQKMFIMSLIVCVFFCLFFLVVTLVTLETWLFYLISKIM